MKSYFLDVIVSLSLLKLPMLILVSSLVIAIESLVLYVFWKEWRLAIGISFLANIGSALIAVPFLLISQGEESIWMDLLSAAANIRDYQANEIVLYLWGIIVFTLIFVVAFIASVLIELLIGKSLKVPEKRIISNFIIANLVSYSMIVLTLIGLGIWFGVTNQDPYVDSKDFFEGFFVQNIPLDSTLLFLQQCVFLIGILLVIFLLILNYRKPSSKPVS